MDRKRETIIFTICFVCIMVLGYCFKEIKDSAAHQKYLQCKIDSLKTKLAEYDTTSTGR